MCTALSWNYVSVRKTVLLFLTGCETRYLNVWTQQTKEVIDLALQKTKILPKLGISCENNVFRPANFVR